MKLSELKILLESVPTLHFQLPDKKFLPAHFHITEAGLTTKHFIDCGGTIREEKYVSMQIWVNHDIAHRLHPEKLLKIIRIAEDIYKDATLEVEIEYQMETIGRYGLDFNGKNFLLVKKKTACLAGDQCGIPKEKQKLNLSDLAVAAPTSCCTPNTGCC